MQITPDFITNNGTEKTPKNRETVLIKALNKFV